MASKLESLISNSISGLKKRDKPLPLRPQRPERLTNFFLPSSDQLSPEAWGSGAWSTLASPQPPPATKSPSTNPLLSPNSLSSPKRPPSFSGFTLTPSPPASLKQRGYAEQRPSLVPKSIEERLARLELENTNLRRANDVLYQQNSDYRAIVQEYRAFQQKATAGIDRHMASMEVLEEVTEAIRADLEVYEAASSRVRKVEKRAVKDWKKFVDTNARAGVEVDKVVKDIVEEHAVDITVYPYKKDPNMI